MAALRMAGSWLQGSGWAETLVQADVASPGTANSFLKAAHVTRTRRGHQITAATLNILQHKAYGKYTEDAQSDGHEPLEFGVWCQQRAECCPQFQYWATTLNLELSICLLDHYENQTSRFTWMLWLNCVSGSSPWIILIILDASLPLVLYLATGKTFSTKVTTKRNSSVSCQNRLRSWLSKKVNSWLSETRNRYSLFHPGTTLPNLAPCNHEEADTRMMVHAADALECGHWRILIRTVDTDVVILAVALANERSEVLDELWLIFGTGKNRRYIAAHQIAKALRPEKSRALPVFHAIMGCDTVSAFTGHSKKAAWATWNAFPEVTTAFLSLASTLSELPDGVLSTLERFIVLLYDRTSTCCDVNVLRKKLFSRKSRSLEDLPPTRAALEQHIKRAAYQAGHIWGQAAITM
ncbi:hypothetical protein Hamer_G003830 [Homarus americanus]|uniref:Uncharacterized protein n=1 Tax=Homarus americanus TaxID=6706 RepID=A0A8J5NEE1_HOMAM|nr:hypothetical protein Hamer_G003830 [Homarus americanus]